MTGLTIRGLRILSIWGSTRRARVKVHQDRIKNQADRFSEIISEFCPRNY